MSKKNIVKGAAGLKYGAIQVNGHNVRLVCDGYCHCGCGQKTSLAKETRKRYNYIKGKPVNYIRWHRSKKYYAKDINPSGLCQCGCGQKTNIINHTIIKYGYYKGGHSKYISGHNAIRNDKCARCNTKPKKILKTGLKISYCSECYSITHARKSWKVYFSECKYCNNWFTARRSNQIYCSKRCAFNNAGINARKELKDSYVKKTITRNSNLTANDIPDGIIALQKECLKIKRFLNKVSWRNYAKHSRTSGSPFGSGN